MLWKPAPVAFAVPHRLSAKPANIAMEKSMEKPYDF